MDRYSLSDKLAMTATLMLLVLTAWGNAVAMLLAALLCLAAFLVFSTGGGPRGQKPGSPIPR